MCSSDLPPDIIGKNGFRIAPADCRCRRSASSCKVMVGTAGFEPAASRTPSECATRLRYVPTRKFYINDDVNE